MYVDEGLLAEIQALMYGTNPAIQIRLFTGAPTITNATVKGDLTEATFAGYGAKNPAGEVFPDPAIDGDGAADLSGPLLTWSASGGISGPETITGIYMTITDRHGVEKLWWAELFAVPVTVTNPGDTVSKKIIVKKRNY